MSNLTNTNPTEQLGPKKRPNERVRMSIYVIRSGRNLYQFVDPTWVYEVNTRGISLILN